MCRLSRKQLLFNHLVDELIGWKSEYAKDSEEVNKANELLQYYDVNQLMKILYFVCVESVTDDSKGLFVLYDRYVAWENGPVEIDVFNNLTTFPTLVLDGEYLRKELQDQNRLEDIYPYYNGYNKDKGDVLTYLINKEKSEYKMNYLKDEISSTLKKLRSNKPLLEKSNTDALIKLSHSLYLWPSAIRYSSPVLYNNLADLKQEKYLFNKRIQML